MCELLALLVSQEQEVNDIWDKLTEKDAEVFSNYIATFEKVIEAKDLKIAELENEISNLEYDNRELEDQIEELESELQCEQENKNSAIKDALNDIVKDRYLYAQPEYNTLEKLQDRIEYIVKYIGD